MKVWRAPCARLCSRDRDLVMPSSLGRGFVLVALVACRLGFRLAGNRARRRRAGFGVPFELGVREARAQGAEVFVPCAIRGRAVVPLDTTITDGGGRPIARFGGPETPLVVSGLSTATPPRARIETGIGQGGFRVRGFLDARKLPLATTENVAVVPGHVWIGARPRGHGRRRGARQAQNREEAHLPAPSDVHRLHVLSEARAGHAGAPRLVAGRRCARVRAARGLARPSRRAARERRHDALQGERGSRRLVFRQRGAGRLGARRVPRRGRARRMGGRLGSSGAARRRNDGSARDAVVGEKRSAPRRPGHPARRESAPRARLAGRSRRRRARSVSSKPVPTRT